MAVRRARQSFDRIDLANSMFPCLLLEDEQTCRTRNAFADVMKLAFNIGSWTNLVIE
jgi:hypothetical protein